MIQFQPLYTMEEAGRILHITESFLWELIKQDRIPYVEICENPFIRGTDLEKFLDGLTGL